jgi:WXG100 family type VII secretion target
MANYGLDPNNLVATSGELRQATTQIEQALQTLDAAVQNYRSSNTGQTSDAFQSAQAKWQAGVHEMEGSLRIGASKLEDISHTYVSTDQKGASSFH